jgi:D-alanyl-D-alanine carboxypeptidase (penicillin-binding protein 5/6)
VRFYDGCDGGKTGFTNEAGFCLAATAKRDNMRIISVVIGEESSKARFDDIRTMFDYAFANYTASSIVEKGTVLEQTAEIIGGKEKNIAVYPERSSYAFHKRGEKGNVTFEVLFDKVKAPIQQGDSLGEIIVYKDGVECDRLKAVASCDVAKANFFDRLKDVANGWNG